MLGSRGGSSSEACVDGLAFCFGLVARSSGVSSANSSTCTPGIIGVRMHSGYHWSTEILTGLLLVPWCLLMPSSEFLEVVVVGRHGHVSIRQLLKDGRQLFSMIFPFPEPVSSSASVLNGLRGMPGLTLARRVDNPSSLVHQRRPLTGPCPTSTQGLPNPHSSPLCIQALHAPPSESRPPGRQPQGPSALGEPVAPLKESRKDAETLEVTVGTSDVKGIVGSRSVEWLECACLCLPWLFEIRTLLATFFRDGARPLPRTGIKIESPDHCLPQVSCSSTAWEMIRKHIGRLLDVGNPQQHRIVTDCTTS